MSADTEPRSAQFTRGNSGILREEIKYCPAICIEIRDGCSCRIVEATGAAGIIEGDYRSRQLDAVVNFRRRDYKSVSCQSHAGAQHGACELKNVGVANDAGIFPLNFRSGDKHSQWRTIDADVAVFSGDDHRAFLKTASLALRFCRRRAECVIPSEANNPTHFCSECGFFAAHEMKDVNARSWAKECHDPRATANRFQRGDRPACRWWRERSRRPRNCRLRVP